jgi:predicted TIM-barrel enzyme
VCKEQAGVHSDAADDAASVRQAVGAPVCIGSGLAPENLPVLWPDADVFIVGSYVNKDGLWSSLVDAQRVGALMEVAARRRVPHR